MGRYFTSCSTGQGKIRVTSRNRPVLIIYALNYQTRYSLYYDWFFHSFFLLKFLLIQKLKTNSCAKSAKHVRLVSYSDCRDHFSHMSCYVGCVTLRPNWSRCQALTHVLTAFPCKRFENFTLVLEDYHIMQKTWHTVCTVTSSHDKHQLLHTGTCQGCLLLCSRLYFS